MGQGTEEPLTEKERDIEATRARLARDTDELGDKLSPHRMVQRRTEAAKGRLGSMRDRVMGSASSAGDTVTSAGSSVSSGAAGAASTVGDRMGDAAHMAQARTQGNPLAAGLVAFGAGMVVSALLPPTEKEKQLGEAAVDTAREHGQPVVEEAKSMGQEVGQNLKDSAKEAAEEVTSTAQDSAETVKQETRSSAESVTDEARPTS